MNVGDCFSADFLLNYLLNEINSLRLCMRLQVALLGLQPRLR